jgi:hypothetical protein
MGIILMGIYTNMYNDIREISLRERIIKLCNMESEKGHQTEDFKTVLTRMKLQIYRLEFLPCHACQKNDLHIT